MRVFVEHGQGTGVVDRGGLALVAGGPGDPVVLLLAKILAEPNASIAVLVDGLVELGVRDLPSFGVVLTRDSGSKVMVRGSVVGTATTVDGAINRYDATRVSTWVEDAVDIAGVALTLGDDVGESDDYWIGGGVVPAASVRWGVETEPADAVEAGQAAEVEEPVADSQPESEMELDQEPAPEAVAEGEPAGESVPGHASEHDSASPDAAPAYDFTHLVDHTVYRSPGDAVVNPEEAESPEQSEDESMAEPLIEDDVPVQPTVAPDHTQSHPDIIDAVPTGEGADEHESAAEPVSAEADPDEPVSPDVDEQQLGDHDGFTVARRKTPREPDPTVPESDGGSGVQLTGVRCPSGHGNNPIADTCIVCGAEIVDHEPVQVERPALGRLRLPSGENVPVSSPIVMGRNPVAVGLIRDEVPQDLVVDDELVSRNHAQLIVEGWNVLISDLHSTNQTTIVLPGQTPRVVSAEESVLIIFGTEIFLGDYGPIIYEASF